MAAEEERVATSRAFSTYGRTLDMVLSFKYLGSLLSAADYDWPEVIQNITKAREFWRRMKRILSREGARLGVFRFFFEAVVQSVLIFGAETWVLTPAWDGSWGFSGPDDAATDGAAPAVETR